MLVLTASSESMKGTVAYLTLTLLAGMLLSGCSATQPASSPDHPTASQPARASATSPAFDLEAIERAVHQRINAVRAEHGLPPLTWNAQLATIAEGHSRDMAEHHFFDHVNLQGERPRHRGIRGGVRCEKTVDGRVLKGIGENLFQTYTYAAYEITYQDGKASMAFEWKTEQQIVHDAVEQWIESPLHRDNLLATFFKTQGIGVALSSDHKLYITQNLC